ncbi:MAG TPA: hypothetical protein VKA30_09955 [Actinomycetota bacterium]|nr:hypothetical protein [Actinomycetota bacterium]
MAFRRAKIKEQFGSAVQEVLEPGEQVQAETLTQSGPSPWLTGLIGWLFMLVAGARFYFIVLTDRRVLFLKASLLSGRPRGLAWADPRGAVRISDVQLGNTLWSKFRYARPEGKELRLNIHRIWRSDAQELVQALTATLSPSELPPPPPGEGSARG